MGLFDFDKKEADNKLAELITQQVSDKFEVQGLQVSVAEKKVSISGSLNSEDTKKSILEMVQGLEGVAGVEDQLEVLEENVEKSDSGAKVYTVQSGDTLWGISEKFLGNGADYMKIFEANKEVWKDYNDDPNVLYPGWKLTIPQ